MKLILGKLNSGAIFYWDISDMKLEPSIGDYAIVEKYCKRLTHSCELKKAVCLLKRNMIRND